ncbi:putative CAAX prenyl protease 2 [Erysiphe neolycopersici]|uniref:intramembrane prenyl-peptidase Rce1 n=1 Tax=Erysiphe neolycopersici TaxID=212602 RepID=A0A420HCM9_9PEZI|nr:putative CAAX prenyl protease 2 [Erysiphe neolycopersici]
MMANSYVTALLTIYMLIYVIPFYLFASTRPSPTRSRDAVPVMQARIRSVTVSSCICSALTFFLITYTKENISVLETVHLMGYLPLGFSEILKSLLLTSILFAGPLFEKGFVDGEWKDWICLKGLRTSVSTWIGWRNYVVVGPITEEVLFRSASIPLMVSSQTPMTRMILQTPLIFGLAHLHHIYEFHITHPHAPMTAALMQSLLQLSYTTAFGAYATFIYVRTGSLFSVIMVHALCNWIGLPRFGGLVGEYYNTINGLSFPSRTSRVVCCTIIYYLLLIMGAWGWWRLLWPLTRSNNRLVDF